MSDTPRTDSASRSSSYAYMYEQDERVVKADFARTLERENAALRAVLRDILNDITRPSEQWSEGSSVYRARALLEKP